MTVQQVALKLGLSEQRIRKLLKEGLLLGEKHGRDWWISEQSLAAFMKLPRRSGRPNND